jgi:hypothetical protein
MATATIHDHSTNHLSWKSSSLQVNKSETSSTVVTNSSGATVYWWEGANSGNITNTGNMTCAQASTTKTWDFSDDAGGQGAAKITLTVTGTGGGGG